MASAIGVRREGVDVGELREREFACWARGAGGCAARGGASLKAEDGFDDGLDQQRDGGDIGWCEVTTVRVIEVREIDAEGAGDGVGGTREGRGGVMPKMRSVGEAEALGKGPDTGRVGRSDRVVLFYFVPSKLAAGMGEGLAAAEEKSHLKGVIRVDGAGVIGFVEVSVVEAIDGVASLASPV